MGNPLPPPAGTGIAPDMGRTAKTLNQVQRDSDEQERQEEEEEIQNYRFDEPSDRPVKKGYTKEEREFNKNFGD